MQYVTEIKKLSPVNPKAKRKNLNGLFVANNSGTIYQRKPYETKAATTLLIRKKEVPPLPSIQRLGLAAGWV